MPRVSVVVPARNAAPHIGEALSSIVAQTFGDWEALVVDDGSTDGTADVARAVDPRIVVLDNPHPAGPAAARNLAIARASGELLALLDADDQWLPSYLERQVGLFDSEQARAGRVGIVACDALILENGAIRREPYSAFAGSAADVTLETLLRSNPIFISAVAPRAVVLDAGGFEPETFGSADHDLWIRIAELGYRVVFNDEPLAVYRKHSSTISGDLVAMARTSELAYRRALERGRLTPAQRRIVRRSLLLQRSVRQVEELLTHRPLPSAPVGVWLHATRGALGLLRYALLSPRRWPGWAKTLARCERAPWRARWDA